MPREELRNTLASLHETLSGTEDVDPETRELLKSVTSDIERILADDESAAEVGDSLTERIEDSMRAFEANHPVIGGLLQRLSDGLANVGI